MYLLVRFQVYNLPGVCRSESQNEVTPDRHTFRPVAWKELPLTPQYRLTTSILERNCEQWRDLYSLSTDFLKQGVVYKSDGFMTFQNHGQYVSFRGVEKGSTT